jgi:ketosteroid isomerase-like protein
MLRRQSIPSLRILSLLLCALLVLPFASAAPHAKNPKKPTYKQQIAELESSWFEARRNNDADAIDKMLSDDYIGISAQGMVSSKTQELDRIRAHQIIIHKLNVQEQKISIHGDTAVVTSLVEVDTTNNATQPPLQAHNRLRYTRVYLRYPSGTWRIVNFEATHINDMPGIFGPLSSEQPAVPATPVASSKP